MGRIGISLDNRPIEYFFSILKQEYLYDGVYSHKKTLIKISESIYDYIITKDFKVA